MNYMLKLIKSVKICINEFYDGFFSWADTNLHSAATNLHTTELAGSMEATDRRDNKMDAVAPHVSYVQALSKTFRML